MCLLSLKLLGLCIVVLIKVRCGDQKKAHRYICMQGSTVKMHVYARQRNRITWKTLFLLFLHQSTVQWLIVSHHAFVLSLGWLMLCKVIKTSLCHVYSIGMMFANLLIISTFFSWENDDARSGFFPQILAISAYPCIDVGECESVYMSVAHHKGFD